MAVQINMPGYQPGQATQLLAALQAAKTYYGIDTEKQQQKLLESQTENQKAETDKNRQLTPLQIEAAKQSNKHSGAMNPLEEEKASLANTQSKALNPLAISEAQAKVKSSQATASNDAELAKEQKNYAAGKDMGPLMALAHNIWGTSGGTTPSAAGDGTASTLPTPSETTISFGNGKTQKAINYPLATQQLEYAKGRQSYENAGKEETRKANSEITEHQTAFNKTVEDAIKDAEAASHISKELTSGNPISAQLAQKRIQMIDLAVARMGNSDKAVETSALVKGWKDKYSKFTKGTLPAEALNELNEANKMIGEDANQRVRNAADRYSGQFAPGLKMKPDEFRDRVLLPGFKGYQHVESRIQLINGVPRLVVNRNEGE